jgi:hypothetical protein
MRTVFGRANWKLSSLRRSKEIQEWWSDAVAQRKVIPLLTLHQSVPVSVHHAEIAGLFKKELIPRIYAWYPRASWEKPQDVISKLRAIFPDPSAAFSVVSSRADRVLIYGYYSSETTEPQAA